MKTKLKGELLYQKLRGERERLVKKYGEGGTIRYDEAIGLIPMGGNPAVSQAPAAVGGTPVANNGRRETRIIDAREDGFVVGSRVVLDLAAIKAANIADGIPSGTMMDALKKRAEGKTVLLFADDAALRYGTIILGEVECQLKLQGDIVNAIRNAVFPGFQASNSTLNGVLNTGLVHALPGTVEQESLSHRGLAKPVNYRGDVEYLKDPTSIWATTDASRQPIMLLGINSEIRMWGANQVIDLCGFKIGAHERPNRVAAFSSIIDLSNGHFLGLSSKGARNAHIYSSTGKGRLLRNNHFAIRGHMVKGVLIEGIESGEEGTVNQGSYFGTAIFNDPSEVVMKDVHQKMLNKAVSNSSMALSHYAQLANIEIALGYFERPSTWETSGKLACPWMKWEPIASGATDTFGHGKTTRYPVLKTEAELTAAGVPSAQAARVRKAVQAMMAAHKKSMKSADDTYIQVNTGHNALNVAGANRAGLSMDSLQRMTSVKQIPRSANLIAQNPMTDDKFRYPDSVAYGARFGSSDEGVGALAVTRGGTVEDCYVMDCSFKGMHIAPMEHVSISSPTSGQMKTFNGNGLRTFGYTNTLSDAASIAPSLVLMSKEAIEEAVPASKLEPKPVDSFDTAFKAVSNISGEHSWTAKKAHGLYKGNDVVEAGLAAVEAIQLLKKYFTAAIPQAQLGGVDNSSVDIGILALRKSMMEAIGALTACHVGLKGGYQGDIFADDGTYYGYGEIYPWFVSGDEAVSIDKDFILQQAAARTDRRQTTAYLPSGLPDLSDSVWKLKLVDAETMALVTADTETPVTYEQCITLLGFGSGTGPVTYKIARNLDGQNHTHKGVFGVRFDQATRVAATDVVIRDLKTEGKAPIGWLGSVSQQEAAGVNTAARPESGAMEIHGVSLNGVSEALVEDVLIADCDSRGSVYGVEVAGQSIDVEVEKVRCESLKAGASGKFAQPFGDQKAVGVRVLGGTSEIKVVKPKSEKLEADRPDLQKEIEIESIDVSLS
jgi:hypothetical protein